jgi:NTP pyrophosphatase (non-canonical NTP hydrolase)
MNIRELVERAGEQAKRTGFTDATVGEDIALMHSELSEALEDFRAGRGVNETWYENKLHPGAEGLVPQDDPDNAANYKPQGIPTELADVIIRILHFSHRHGIDIETAVLRKMQYNATRPHRHGGKKL